MALELTGKTARQWWPRPRTKLGKWTWWSFLAWLVLWPVTKIPRAGIDDWASLARFVAFMVFVCAGVPWLVRWIRRKLLWRLRNKLLLTYLLVGLAPFVLLSILFGLIGYLFAGQFAIFVASQELNQQVYRQSTEASEIALHLAHLDSAAWNGNLLVPEARLDSDGNGRTLNVFRDGKLVKLGAGMPPADPDITAPPAWMNGQFEGIVRHQDRLYARAVATRQEGGKTVSVVSSEPITSGILSRAAEGFGLVTLYNAAIHNDENKRTKEEKNAAPKETIGFNYDSGQGANVKVQTDVQSFDAPSMKRRSLSGGELMPKQHWYDINVTFFTPLAIRDWLSGDALTTPLSVSSRPSLLYHRLFSSSVTLGLIIRAALITIAIIFALIECVALVMAASLNRSITRSVAALYDATLRVDKGDLEHQIAVRQDDQLGELSRSFNRMTASLVRLLEEQKEKERMQSELSIAKEVQANLFPRADVRLASLEVHGVSRAARTVGGDYYDFLMFSEGCLGVALGDISGKGISAALLMATLHSAVRAYRFAAEEIVEAEFTQKANGNGVVAEVETEIAEMFESPGRILSLLNRHLYRSTQPEKYATLWLGHYDGARARLTYSNGGQLPPLVLCHNGEVKRLDRGGTVVGLLDNMSYDEGFVDLAAGDILIAYSDGVTEPENDFGDFGEDRLVEIVKRHREAPLEVISGQVLQALNDWIGGQEQPDDITLVLARQL